MGARAARVGPKVRSYSNMRSWIVIVPRARRETGFFQRPTSMSCAAMLIPARQQRAQGVEMGDHVGDHRNGAQDQIANL